jgi:hypothetical protein
MYVNVCMVHTYKRICMQYIHIVCIRKCIHGVYGVYMVQCNTWCECVDVHARGMHVYIVFQNVLTLYSMYWHKVHVTYMLYFHHMCSELKQYLPAFHTLCELSWYCVAVCSLYLDCSPQSHSIDHTPECHHEIFPKHSSYHEPREPSWWFHDSKLSEHILCTTIMMNISNQHVPELPWFFSTCFSDHHIHIKAEGVQRECALLFLSWVAVFLVCAFLYHVEVVRLCVRC